MELNVLYLLSNMAILGIHVSFWGCTPKIKLRANAPEQCCLEDDPASFWIGPVSKDMLHHVTVVFGGVGVAAFLQGYGCWICWLILGVKKCILIIEIGSFTIALFIQFLTPIMSKLLFIEIFSGNRLSQQPFVHLGLKALELISQSIQCKSPILRLDLTTQAGQEIMRVTFPLPLTSIHSDGSSMPWSWI